METNQSVHRGLTIGKTFFIHLDFPGSNDRTNVVSISVEVLALDKLKCGFSFQSNKDAYDRKLGNKVAENRRKSYRNYATTITIPNNATMKQIKECLRDHLNKGTAIVWNERHTTELLPRWMNNHLWEVIENRQV